MNYTDLTAYRKSNPFMDFAALKPSAPSMTTVK